VFLIEMNRKLISIPNVMRFTWLRAKGFRIMHCILVFVILKFELCLFQLVVFHFSRLIVSALCICFLFSVSVGCIPFQY